MAGEAAKVKFLCSFGGKIAPRPGDNALRYLGGHTRIVSLRRDVSFSDLLLKMSSVLGSPDVVLKYQLPDEDLDALVTVSCSDDLDNMMEEYDKLIESCPDGSAKLRVFLFDPPFSLLTPDPITAPSDPAQRYIDALNMVPPPAEPLRRKDSSASASTQNSDPPPPQDPPFEAAPSTDYSTSSSSGLNTTPASFLGATNPPPLYAPQQEQFGYTNFVPNYLSSQQFGLARPSVRYVAMPAPPGSYMPGVHSVASPIQYLEENAYGGSAGLVYEESSSGKVVPPLSKLPPLSPFSNLQPRNGDRYGGGGWQQVQVPAHLIQGHGSRMEECALCQKGLPHAHSDILSQDKGVSGLVMGMIHEVNPMYHTLLSEDVVNLQLPPQPKMVSMVVPDRVSEQRTEILPSLRVASPVNCYDYSPQIPMMASGSEVVHAAKVENVDQSIHVFAPVSAGFPADLGTLYMTTAMGGYTHPGHVGGDQLQPHQSVHVQSMQHQVMQDLLPHKISAVDSNPQKAEMVHASETQQHPHLLASQCPVMQDLLTNKVTSIDSNPTKIDKVHTLQQPLSEGVGESSVSHAKPVEVMMESLHVSSGIPVVHEQRKATAKSGASTPRAMDSESPVVIMEGRDNSEPFEAKDLLSSAFSNRAMVPEVSLGKPTEQLQTSNLDFAYLSSIQPTGQPPHLPPFPLPPVAVGEPPIPHKRLLGVANANKLTGGDKREQPAIPLGNMLSDVSSALSNNPLLPLSNTGRSSETITSEVRNHVPLDSLFSDTDSWGIQQIVQPQAPKPVRVASGGSLVTKDPGAESNPSPTAESSHSEVTGKGNVQRIPLDLNRDPLLDLIQPSKEATNGQSKGLQIATESLAAPVIQPSVLPPPPVPIVPGAGGPSHEMSKNTPESHTVQVIHTAADSILKDVHELEDGKPKQADKPNHGFQITEDIELQARRDIDLQIIKNSDLEELRELGSGTFGTVYHGKWKGTDVAIKRISDRCFAGKLSDQERLRNDFWNEACNLADLHHPNVVAFYGVVLDGPGGSVATVTEFMVNGSLRNALQQSDKSLDTRKRLRIAMDVACGMEYLHEKKIVHFDLKSDNLLVNLRDPHRPICKVGDLGLSKVKCQTLISGGVRGTLPWMAPELLSGDSHLVSDKVDVFSFGIVMWELLTGEEPYADLHYGAIIGGIVNNTLRPPIPESCDPEWRSLMEKCWSAEPSDRPTFAEVVVKLKAMVASYPRKGQTNQITTSSLLHK